MCEISTQNGQTGIPNINSAKEQQFNNFQNQLNSFINYNVLLKIGNASQFDKRNFLSIVSPKTTTINPNSGVDVIFDPIQYNSYNANTPNALPTQNNGITLAQSKTTYPDAWQKLNLFVGDTSIEKIKFTDTGSTVFDFFIDNDIEFTDFTVPKLYPLIRIYATKKAEDKTKR